MNRLYEITERKSNIVLYFPESFEWLILKSGLVTDGDIKTILKSRKHTSKVKIISAGNDTLQNY